ncbi:MAG: DRTGG domain-containing protein [Spirochaetota bacterium]
MTANEIIALVDGSLLTEEHCDHEVEYAFAADLMSDVLTLTHDNVLFITGLVAPQTIRTAIVSDIHTLLIVRGKQVPASIVTLATENEICLLTSPYSMYRASGELYKAGLKPVF